MVRNLDLGALRSFTAVADAGGVTRAAAQLNLTQSDVSMQLKRLEGQLEPIEVEAMDEAEMAKHPALVKGYIGPEVLGEESKSGIRFLVDPRVVEGTRWVTGANVPGSHVLDLVVGRDFTPDGTIEAADVRDGDACPQCSLRGDDGVLESARGRGVATGLLRTIIADAASRGWDRVGLEVDADSPTGADGLYTSMGWATRYVTESWHKDVPVSRD